jgi:hypothetical protein
VNQPYSSQTKPAITLDWKLHIFNKPFHYGGAHTVVQLGAALRYKLEGCMLDS